VFNPVRGRTKEINVQVPIPTNDPDPDRATLW
jgi:hypothetical protein